MTDRNPDTNRDDDVLENNLEQLLTRAHQPPRMSDAGRARVLHNLKVRQRSAARRPESSRTTAPRGWWGWMTAHPGLVGAACVAAVAVTVFQVTRRSSHRPARVHVNQTTGPERVALDDGSEMILNQDTAITVLGPRHLRLERGEVLLDVAKGGGNFVVDAPHGRAVVLGTRFVINAGAEETWAAVVRGRVRIENQVGAETLRPGEQGFLRDGKMPIRRAAPRLSHLTSWAKLARRQEEGKTTQPARRGTLLARNPRWQSQEFPLPLRDLTIDVHVENQVARVAIDQTFFNPQQQQLEGVYRFALPPGAAISRQAMYVDGKRMESAIVERQRGRHIYEEIVYTNRDPALLEWMAGNLFKVRIFPLPARTEKRILISYTQSLERLYDDYRLEVPIPEVDNSVRSVRYQVRLVDCPDCSVKSTSHDIETARDGNDTLVSFAREGYQLGDDLLLTIRDPATKPRVAAHAVGDQRYYLARIKPTITAPAATAVARRWVILHDTSASRTPLERKAQAFLIDHFLREVDENDQVNLLAFDTTVRQLAPDFLRVGDLGRRRVANFLSAQSEDGVGYTDLEKAIDQALQLLAAGGDGFAPHILYLGDGIVTGGDRRISGLRDELSGHATFVGIGVGERVDANLLGALAAATGGLFTTMNPGDDLGWRVFDLVAALNTPRVVELQATLVDGEGAAITDAELYPSATQLADGEELSVVARLGAATPAAVTLSGSVGGQPWRQTVALPAVTAGSGAGYLPRLWAQRRIDSLIAADAESNQKEITELGIDNFLITPFTSLIVLENREMYRRFKVKENRKLGWAAYPAPDQIDVVHEPLDSAVVPDDVALDAVLLRTPLQVLQRYGGYGGYDFKTTGQHDLVVTSSPGFSDDWNTVGGLDGLTVTGALSGGDFGTIGHGGGGKGWDDDQTGVGTGYGAMPMEEATPKADRAGAADEDAEFDGRDNEVAQTIVTTESLHRQPTSWKTAKVGGMRGRGLGPRRIADKSGSFDGELAGGMVRTRASSAYSVLANREPRRKGAGRGLNRQGRYHGYYNSAPVPVAYNYAPDPRFYDLTEFVPGLFADAFDVDRQALEQAGKDRRGSISRDARALIERARAGQRPSHYRFADGEQMTLDEQGRFRLVHQLDSGLGEELVFTGTSLYRLYPELGLAVRRDAANAAPLVHARWAPFVISDPDALARWYDVTLADPRTIRLGLGGDTSVEVVLDGELRVVEVAVVSGDPATTAAAPGSRPGVERSVQLSLEYRAGQMILVRGGQREVVSVTPATEPLPELVDGDFAVVDMPLHQPAYFTAKLADLEAGTPEWRHVMHQILASQAALGNLEPLWDRFGELAAAGGPTRGELVLASRSMVRAADTKQLAKLLAPLAEDPVADYLEASYRYSQKQRVVTFDTLAARASGSLLGMLASYRGVLAVMWGGSGDQRRDMRRRIEQFIALYPRSTFTYLAAQQFAARWAWQAPVETAAIWDRAAAGADPDGPWPAIIGYEAARGLYSAGKYDDAAERFEQLLSVQSARGFLPVVDQTVAWAFKNSSRGQAGWRLFWSRWREQVLRAGDAEALLQLLQSALVSGEGNDIERISTRVVEVGVGDPDTALALVDLLYQAGRSDQALALLTPQLTAGQPAPELYERASWIAEQQGRVAAAIDYLERAMAVYYAEEAELSAIRGDYTRLLNLYTRRVEAAPADQRAALSAKALGYAAEWRKADPDNSQIDQMCARMLFGLGRPEEAWRYLSTAIEQHPMEGSAFQVVADALESEGRIEEAEKLWQRAFEVEPLNPTWLLRRANALFALGQKAEALALLDKITGFDDWHANYSGVVYQAQAIQKRMAQ